MSAAAACRRSHPHRQRVLIAAPRAHVGTRAHSRAQRAAGSETADWLWWWSGFGSRVIWWSIRVALTRGGSEAERGLLKLAAASCQQLRCRREQVASRQHCEHMGCAQRLRRMSRVTCKDKGVAGGCVLRKGVRECVRGFAALWHAAYSRTHQGCLPRRQASCATGAPQGEVCALGSVTPTRFVV